MFSTGILKTARNSSAVEFFSDRLATVPFVYEHNTSFAAPLLCSLPGRWSIGGKNHDNLNVTVDVYSAWDNVLSLCHAVYMQLQEKSLVIDSACRWKLPRRKHYNVKFFLQVFSCRYGQLSFDPWALSPLCFSQKEWDLGRWITKI